MGLCASANALNETHGSSDSDMSSDSERSVDPRTVADKMSHTVVEPNTRLASRMESLPLIQEFENSEQKIDDEQNGEQPDHNLDHNQMDLENNDGDQHFYGEPYPSHFKPQAKCYDNAEDAFRASNVISGEQKNDNNRVDCCYCREVDEEMNSIVECSKCSPHRRQAIFAHAQNELLKEKCPNCRAHKHDSCGVPSTDRMSYTEFTPLGKAIRTSPMEVWYCSRLEDALAKGQDPPGPPLGRIDVWKYQKIVSRQGQCLINNQVRWKKKDGVCECTLTCLKKATPKGSLLTSDSGVQMHMSCLRQNNPLGVAIQGHISTCQFEMCSVGSSTYPGFCAAHPLLCRTRIHFVDPLVYQLPFLPSKCKLIIVQFLSIDLDLPAGARIIQGELKSYLEVPVHGLTSSVVVVSDPKQRSFGIGKKRNETTITGRSSSRNNPLRSIIVEKENENLVVMDRGNTIKKYEIKSADVKHMSCTILSSTRIDGIERYVWEASVLDSQLKEMYATFGALRRSSKFEFYCCWWYILSFLFFFFFSFSFLFLFS